MFDEDSWYLLFLPKSLPRVEFRMLNRVLEKFKMPFCLPKSILRLHQSCRLQNFPRRRDMGPTFADVYMVNHCLNRAMLPDVILPAYREMICY